MVVDWVVDVISKDEDEMNPVVAWVVVVSKADGDEDDVFWNRDHGEEWEEGDGDCGDDREDGDNVTYEYDGDNGKET